MEEIRGLSFEQNKKYQFAIASGYFDEWEADPRKWKHTFIGSFIWKYPTRVKVLNLLADIIGHSPMWEDLNDDVLHDFVDDLTDSVAQSSANVQKEFNEQLLHVYELRGGGRRGREPRGDDDSLRERHRGGRGAGVPRQVHRDACLPVHAQAAEEDEAAPQRDPLPLLDRMRLLASPRQESVHAERVLRQGP